MRPQSSIHRSIGKMTLDLHRTIEAQRARTEDYGLAERELQYQYVFAGQIGTDPVEAQITIPFTIMAFVADAGMQRDSSLDRPHLRINFEIAPAPPGIIAYGHLTEWTRDDDYNYVGAIVTIGFHCPVLPDAPGFQGLAHIAFQGWGAPVDLDGPFDAGGIQDNGGLT